ncbi:calcium-binding protein [Donghicola sp.]|jgi:Ca2+-binding RTX toxin-like protein|uniref:calcium-binding protein n=1 Tax=Donghicola sp. TaxID=1929294 RepID=UPI0025F65191|nr:calcium-binding protein [Donghicola sp.]MCT4577714.1 hypothetical protein [Donghicola sp.]
MRALWDLSKTKGLPATLDWSFLNWSSEAYLDENAELQNVKIESSSYGFVNDTEFRKFDIAYEDRITFSDGMLEYEVYGSALDDLSDTDSALITAIVFSDSTTGASWTLAFENEQTKIPIRSPYVVDEFASPTLRDLIETFAISEGTLSSLTDRVYGSPKADLVNGGQARDYIKGAAGNDTLIGGNGQDQLFGLDGDDRILGGGKDDHLAGNAGNDTLIGGRGDDHLSAGFGWSNNDDLLRGGLGDDYLYTNKGSDTLLGGAGDDEITAGIPDEEATRILRGGDGDDTITDEGSKNTIMRGDDGNDELHSLSTYGNVRAKMYGGSGNDTLYSRSKRDQLFGGEGDDRIVSRSGNELSAGGSGNDTIRAGQGNDTLRGGSGDDRLFGGKGADVFTFHENNGNDTIFDFNLRSDILRIESALVGGLADGAHVISTYSELNSQGNVVLVFSAENSVEFRRVSEEDLDSLSLGIEFF